MIVLIFSILAVIALIAKEELQLNEEIIISISFIITIAILKAMLKESANETFKERSEEQETTFIQKGQRKKIYYTKLKIIAKVSKYFIEEGDNIFNSNMIFLKHEKHLVLRNKIKNYVLNESISFSNLIIDNLFKKNLNK